MLEPFWSDMITELPDEKVLAQAAALMGCKFSIPIARVWYRRRCLEIQSAVLAKI